MQVVHVPDRWCVHSYYTVCPWAPDGSGRLLLSGANLEAGRAELLVADAASGELLQRAADEPVTESFWHTGCWQTWGPTAQTVYYQGGSLHQPVLRRRDLATGQEASLPGSAEGAPPHGEPLLSGLLGLLYAAGYGTNRYDPGLAPVPFAERDRHGLFEYRFDPPQARLALSVAELLDQHPHRDRLRAAERAAPNGLTLMLYCVRWSPSGERFLVYFGNHCVVSDRAEPRLSYVFTARRDLTELRLAVDLSFERRGVHWSWHPDGEHLLGYGPRPDGAGQCLAQVRFDGEDYRLLSSHRSGGHPSISPTDHRLLVTDESTRPGRVVFVDLKTDTELAAYSPGRVWGEVEPPGRNPNRVCHHPVFSPDGRQVLVNTLPGRCAQVALLDAPGAGR